MTQTSFGYSPEERAKEVWQDELAWARRAVTLLGLEYCASAFDCKASTLSDALKERVMPDGNKKGLRAEWIAILRHLSSPEMRTEYLRIVCLPLHHEPLPVRVRTPQEENDEIRSWLERRAAFVFDQMKKELGL